MSAGPRPLFYKRRRIGYNDQSAVVKFYRRFARRLRGRRETWLIHPARTGWINEIGVF
jgi:hypothetical protein